MIDQPIEPGDLLAYLDGVDLPHVEQALQASPGLRQELDELRQAEQVLRQMFGGLPLPDPQDLVDVVTGQATPQQQLRVAAYIRANPAGQQELAALQAAAASRSSSRVRFLAVRQTGALAVRSAAADAIEQSFYVTELAIQVVLRIGPPSNDRWRLEGYVTQHDQPAAGVRVTLRATHARPRPRLTDADGFFAFQRLAAGTYRLQAALPQGTVVLPDIVLRYD